ncbi:Alpha-ketoglutarate-dependent dioxygenase AlkB [Balamuthia mandrillaris]
MEHEQALLSGKKRTRPPLSAHGPPSTGQQEKQEVTAQHSNGLADGSGHPVLDEEHALSCREKKKSRVAMMAQAAAHNNKEKAKLNGHDRSKREEEEEEEEEEEGGGMAMGMEDVVGLKYYPNFLSKEEEAFLLQKIDEQPWLSDLRRRVQHYGYKYDYTKKKLDKSAHLGPLPSFCKDIVERLLSRGILSQAPDQVIVNEYLPGQGINPHIDKPELFHDGIVSVSLGSSCVMEFKNSAGQKRPMALDQRSLVLLTGPSRYEWTHSIPARRKDKLPNGLSFERKRRVSLTFRRVIL